MEEMMDDALDVEEDDEIEEEADAEVDKVLSELTDGKLGQAGSVGTGIPVRLSCLNDFGVLDRFLVSLHRTSWTTKRQREQWSNIGNN